jgi:hypothetical protein
MRRKKVTNSKRTGVTKLISVAFQAEGHRKDLGTKAAKDHPKPSCHDI